jgi:hypothetical protein
MTKDWQSYMSDLAGWYARVALTADDPKRANVTNPPPAPPSSDPFGVTAGKQAETPT